MRATRSHTREPSASSSSWMSAPPGFDVRTSTNIRPPDGLAGVGERLQRVRSQVRVDGQRIGQRRRRAPRREIRRGVGLGRRADVAALAVGDHQEPALARVLGHALGGRQAVMAGLLEERELRLDGDGVLGDRVDDARAEALDRPREARRARRARRGTPRREAARAAGRARRTARSSALPPAARDAPGSCSPRRQATARSAARRPLRPRRRARPPSRGGPAAVPRAAARAGARPRRA